MGIKELLNSIALIVDAIILLVLLVTWFGASDKSKKDYSTRVIYALFVISEVLNLAALLIR